jgi:HlyD family secretion protein
MPANSSHVQSPGVPVAQGPSVVPRRREAVRRPRWNWRVGIAALAAVGAGAYYLNVQREAKSASRAALVSVPTVVAVVGEVAETVRVNGTVNAKNFATLLAPRIMGSRSGLNRGGDGGSSSMDFTLVLMHLAKPGVHVKAGDVVAEFDPQNQLLRLDDYKDSALQQENTVKKMLANLSAVKEAHDQAVRGAKADWEKAQLDLKTIAVRSAIDAEKYRLAVEETGAQYKQLVYEATLVEDSQRAQIRISQLNRDQSKIETARAEANVRKMTVAAPMDGIVVMQSIVRNGEFGQIREGDQVAAGQPFVQIVDPRAMVLNATVNQVDAEKLRMGMKAAVHLDAYPEVELPGTLVGIGAMAKPNNFRARYVGEIPIRIQIAKADARIIPDLTGSAEITLRDERDAIVAPRAAVFAEEGGSYVFVQSPDGWVKKKVELGLASFTTVGIRSGIQSGDVLALAAPQ